MATVQQQATTNGVSNTQSSSLNPEVVRKYILESDPRIRAFDSAMSDFRESTLQTAAERKNGALSNFEQSKKAVDESGFWLRVSGGRAALVHAREADLKMYESYRLKEDELKTVSTGATNAREQFLNLEIQGRILHAQADALASHGEAQDAEQTRQRAQLAYNEAHLCFQRGLASLGVSGAVDTTKYLSELRAVGTELHSADTKLKYTQIGLAAAPVVVASGGAMIAAAGLASGTMTVGLGVGAMTSEMGVVGATVTGIAGGTLVATAGGAPGHAVEMLGQVAVGNKTFSQAASDARAQVIADSRMGATSAISTVAGLGATRLLGAGASLATQGMVAGGTQALTGGVLNTGIDVAYGARPLEMSTLTGVAQETAVGALTAGMGSKFSVARQAVGGNLAKGAIIATEVSANIGAGVTSARIRGAITGEEVRAEDYAQEVTTAFLGSVMGEVTSHGAGREEYVKKPPSTATSSELAPSLPKDGSQAAIRPPETQVAPVVAPIPSATSSASAPQAPDTSSVSNMAVPVPGDKKIVSPPGASNPSPPIAQTPPAPSAQVQPATSATPPPSNPNATQKPTPRSSHPTVPPSSAAPTVQEARAMFGLPHSDDRGKYSTGELDYRYQKARFEARGDSARLSELENAHQLLHARHEHTSSKFREDINEALALLNLRTEGGKLPRRETISRAAEAAARGLSQEDHVTFQAAEKFLRGYAGKEIAKMKPQKNAPSYQRIKSESWGMLADDFQAKEALAFPDDRKIRRSEFVPLAEAALKDPSRSRAETMAYVDHLVDRYITGTSSEPQRLSARIDAYERKYEAFATLGISIKNPLREPIFTSQQLHGVFQARVKEFRSGKLGHDMKSLSQIENAYDFLLHAKDGTLLWIPPTTRKGSNLGVSNFIPGFGSEGNWWRPNYLPIDTARAAWKVIQEIPRFQMASKEQAVLGKDVLDHLIRPARNVKTLEEYSVERSEARNVLGYQENESIGSLRALEAHVTSARNAAKKNFGRKGDEYANALTEIENARKRLEPFAEIPRTSAKRDAALLTAKAIARDWISPTPILAGMAISKFGLGDEAQEVKGMMPLGSERIVDNWATVPALMNVALPLATGAYQGIRSANGIDITGGMRSGFSGLLNGDVPIKDRDMSTVGDPSKTGIPSLDAMVPRDPVQGNESLETPSARPSTAPGESEPGPTPPPAPLELRPNETYDPEKNIFGQRAVSFPNSGITGVGEPSSFASLPSPISNDGRQNPDFSSLRLVPKPRV